MSMTKTIEIDGRQVSFRASAAIPRIYRMKFHRDIYKDLAALEKAVGKGSPDESRLDMLSNTRTLPSRTRRRNGWTVSALSPSTRCFPRSSSFGG